MTPPDGPAAAAFFRARRVVRCALLLGAWAATGGAARGADTFAPAFGERSLHVLHVPFLAFGPADPASPAPGKGVIAIEAAYSSTFVSTWHPLSFHRDAGLLGKPFTPAEAQAIHATYPGDAVFLVESDVLRVSATPRIGISPGWSISAELVWVSHDAIHGGSAIESFHRIFGLDQPGRKEFPADAFAIVLQRPQRAMTFEGRVPASGAGDTTATLSWRPERGSAWTFGGDVAVKAPTGRARDENGSGSWDAGALAFARREGSRWTIDGELGEVVPGKWRAAAGLPVDPFGRVFVGATRSFGARTRIGASATVEQSPFWRDRIGALSHPRIEFALGVERDVGHASARLTLVDNLHGYGGDFAAALRLRFR